MLNALIVIIQLQTPLVCINNKYDYYCNVWLLTILHINIIICYDVIIFILPNYKEQQYSNT